MLAFSLLTELAQLEARGVCHPGDIQGFPRRRALAIAVLSRRSLYSPVHTRASSQGSVLFRRVTCAVCSFAVNTVHRANLSLINYSHSLSNMNYKRSPWAYKKVTGDICPNCMYTGMSAVPASLTSNLKFHVLQKSLGFFSFFPQLAVSPPCLTLHYF